MRRLLFRSGGERPLFLSIQFAIIVCAICFSGAKKDRDGGVTESRGGVAHCEAVYRNMEPKFDGFSLVENVIINDHPIEISSTIAVPHPLFCGHVNVQLATSKVLLRLWPHVERHPCAS